MSDWKHTVIHELRRPAFLWARQCCDFNEEEAKEVMQSVYLQILEGKAIFKGRSTVRTWLFSVIRYASMNRRRSNERFVSLEEAPEAAQGTERKSYEHQIQQLPEQQRQIIILVFYHDLTIEDAASVMDVHVGTARTHYDRAKKKLREILKTESYAA